MALHATSLSAYPHDHSSHITYLNGDASGNDVGIGFSCNPASQVAARAQTNSLYDHPIGVVNQTYTSNGRNQYTQVAGTNGGCAPQIFDPGPTDPVAGPSPDCGMIAA